MSSPFESSFYKPSKAKKAKPAPDYVAWLARGKKLADKHSGYQWKIGDWLIEGEEHFDFKNVVGEIPGYMLLRKATDENGEACHKSIKLPNFWKEISDEIGLAVSTLKQYAQVARAYAKKKQRLKKLGWSHHMIVCTYARRAEYLKACLDVPDGQRPHSISWLWKLVAKEEGLQESDGTVKGCSTVHISVPPEMYGKLKELARYYGTDIADVVAAPFKAALEVFLEEQKKKISLDLFSVYEVKGQNSVWPFDRLQTRRQKATFWEGRRLRPRMMGDDVKQFSEAQAARARASWAKRRARRHNGLTLLITRTNRFGRVA